MILERIWWTRLNISASSIHEPVSIPYRLSAFGYKTNKNGFLVGTSFEYLDDFRLGVGSSNFYEKIETDSSASTRQKAQAGNYWDTFLNIDLDYDKRNQKYKTSDGFRSFYSICQRARK